MHHYIEAMEEDPDAKMPHPNHPLLDVFVFLASLSIENLLKGFLVRDNPSLISGGKLRGDLITSHDLNRLANKINLAFSDEEQKFLTFGTMAIQYWGRYPIPKDINKLESIRRVNAKIGQVYSGLYDRLLTELEADPWPKFQTT